MSDVGVTARLQTVPREARRLWESAKFLLRDKGPRYVVGDGVDFMWSMAAFPLAERRRRGRQFTLGDRSYEYFVHHYNRAWRNERTVEIALGGDFLDEHSGRRVLEVGNVLAHYGHDGHDVLDKYEHSPGVLNHDVVDFRPARPYDAIVSISTLEHVGWDEQPRDSEKTLRACNAMRDMIAPGGELLLTCPLGQNPYLDKYLAEQALPFDDRRYMRRVDDQNRWVECSFDEVRGSRYGSPYRNANALFVGRMRR